MLTFEEFLTFEAAYAGDERFELRGGTVVLTAGGTERHDLMVMTLFRAIDPGFTAGPCRVFVHNRKIRTSEKDGWYPDLLVRCGPTAHPLYETDARIVVEVLSRPTTRTTARHDDGAHLLRPVGCSPWKRPGPEHPSARVASSAAVHRRAPPRLYRQHRHLGFSYAMAGSGTLGPIQGRTHDESYFFLRSVSM